MPDDKDYADWKEWAEYCESMEAADLIAEINELKVVPAYQPVVKTLPASPQTTQKVGPVCECGAAKCKTTHAHWCPLK